MAAMWKIECRERERETRAGQIIRRLLQAIQVRGNKIEVEAVVV